MEPGQHRSEHLDLSAIKTLLLNGQRKQARELYASMHGVDDSEALKQCRSMREWKDGEKISNYAWSS